MDASRVLRAAGILAAGLAAAAAPVVAQEGAPRARLGLFLAGEDCAIVDEVRECSSSPVIASVVEDGPAYRAGVRVRDTLIALDGHPLVSREGRIALQTLEPGTSVTLLLSGPGGRREVEVSPEIRAPAHVMHFEWRDPQADGTGERVRLYRLPSPEALEELEAHFDSVSTVMADEHTFVMFGANEEGELRLEVVGSDPVAARARVRGEAAAREHPPAWVVESRDLARRLEEVRARTLEVARVRLDSLLRLQGDRGAMVVVPGSGLEPDHPESLLIGAESGEVPYRWAVPAVGPLLESSRRIAGAEFRSLTPDLAEYFAGVERGLLVMRVIPGTPAARLGLRGGDVVVECDEAPVHSIEAFRTAIAQADTAGTKVKWIRKGHESSGTLTFH